MLSINSMTVTDRPVTVAIVTICLIWFLTFLTRLITWRLRFRKLQAQGMPMPPHSLWFGHLPIIIRLLGQLPSDAHPFYMPDMIRRNYPDLGPNFYMDCFPFAPSLLVIGSPDTLYQITNEHVLQKTPILRNFLRPLTNGLDIVCMEGATWKKWRAIFNPGFSAAHLMTLVPAIVKETETYCKVLDYHVEKHDIFEMKQLSDNLTLDIIGRVALDIHFDCQRKSNEMINSLRTQIRWFSTGVEPNPFARHNPLRPLVHWYHSKIVNKYVSKELDKRFQLLRDEANKGDSNPKRTRTIIDLALNAYNASLAQDGSQAPTAAMDPFFRRICLAQLKVFLFSGHDTTSSAICYHLYLLSQNPPALAHLRKEHDSVFGTDTTQAASLISKNANLLNQLPYTTAVIKESLRLFPTVTTSRCGEKDFFIRDSQGRSLPTEDLVVWPNMHTPQHDPAYWPDPESFLPERWLSAPGDPLYPIKGAWRAFEHGPRACIAQELAMIEMKIVLVLVARNYVFKPAYDFLDAKNGGEQPMVHGEKAYQVGRIMEPRGNMPGWVEKMS